MAAFILHHIRLLVAFILRMYHGLSHPSMHPLFDTKQWSCSLVVLGRREPHPGGVTSLRHLLGAVAAGRHVHMPGAEAPQDEGCKVLW